MLVQRVAAMTCAAVSRLPGEASSCAVNVKDNADESGFRFQLRETCLDNSLIDTETVTLAGAQIAASTLPIRHAPSQTAHNLVSCLSSDTLACKLL